MIYGLYNSAAGMLVHEYRQSVIANNLANADTVGFRRDIPVFAERLTAEQVGERRGRGAADLASLSGGLWLGKTHTDETPGDIRQTGNPLDVAVAGRGYLVFTKAGQPLYSRDGRLLVDPEGRLASAADGAPVMGAGGFEIRVNPDGGLVSINREGLVEQDGAVAGQLAVVDFDPQTPMLKAGDTRYMAPPDAAVASTAELRSGVIEDSSTEATHELVDMIASTRAYQMNAQMVSLQDQTLGRLIGVISR